MDKGKKSPQNIRVDAQHFATKQLTPVLPQGQIPKAPHRGLLFFKEQPMHLDAVRDAAPITLKEEKKMYGAPVSEADEEIAKQRFTSAFTPDDLFQNIDHDDEEQILKALADGDELEAGHILARIRQQVICRYASQACYGNSTTIQPE
jgi:hypothetical protein